MWSDQDNPIVGTIADKSNGKKTAPHEAVSGRSDGESMDHNTKDLLKDLAEAYASIEAATIS